jgi:DNA-binding LacI/PurR family transcriptional regulator
MARAANQSDVARAAGVSVSTVSRALSNSRGISSQLRQQIQGLARELGYAARGPAAAENRVVRAYVTVNLMSGGLVAFYSALVDGLKATAASAGIDLEVKLVRQGLDPQRIVRDVAEDGTAASLLVGLDMTPEIAALFGPDHPVVLVNTFDPEMRFDCVAPNNFYGAVQATQQLLDAGHRHVLHIREQIRWTTLQREYGFMNAVNATTGATGEVLDILADGDAALARAAQLKASGKARWTGVYAVHDNAAIRFIHALEEVGLHVPRDVSVIGFDDLPAAAMMHPRLSTMRVDTASIGQQAIALLLRRLADPGAARLQVESGVEPVAGATISQFSA